VIGNVEDLTGKPRSSIMPPEYFESAVSIKFIDVKTGIIKDTLRGRHPRRAFSMEGLAYSPLDAIHRAIVNALSPLAGQLNGFVIHVDNNQVTIDAGQTSGVSVKQKFDVIREGDMMYHPATGKEIERSQSVIAELEITRVTSNTAIGKVKAVKVNNKTIPVEAGDKVVRKSK